LNQPSGSLFALLAALGWGTGDFLGGFMSRRASVLMTLLLLQLLGTPLSIVALVFSGETAPTSAGVAWAGLAGISGLAGVGLLFLALSRTTMGLVAPMAALIASSVPAIVGIATGDRVGSYTLVGFVAAFLAIVLVTYQSGASSASSRLDWLIVVASGLGSASFFLCVDQAHLAGSETLWTVAIARVSSLLIVSIVVAVLALRGARKQVRWAAGLLPLGLTAAICDTGGTWCYVLATSVGLLSVSVVLASLAPVATTLLARLVLHERLARHQAFGVALAVLGVILINLGA
jgi:drug/metabolite transporter (DMT)-like permease